VAAASDVNVAAAGNLLLGDLAIDIKRSNAAAGPVTPSTAQ
jgi:hypothetical protein